MSLQVNDATKVFAGKPVVRGMSFSVRSGEVFGLLGPNGAGKSTLIRMLVGLSRPCSGEIRVAGLRLWGSDHAAAKARIGYGTQKFSLYENLTVWENIDFFARLRGLGQGATAPLCQAAIESLELGRYKNQAASQLSGGWKQRLTLAVAVINDPSLLVLDEPTAGMDSISRRAVWDYIHSRAHAGTTCVVTTHYMDEAERCGRIGIMIEGEIVALDTPAALCRSPVVNPKGTHRVLVLSVLPIAPCFWKTLPGVVEAIPFGDGWHVLFDHEPDNKLLETRLTGMGVDGARVSDIATSLEDSFVAYATRPRTGHLSTDHSAGGTPGAG